MSKKRTISNLYHVQIIDRRTSRIVTSLWLESANAAKLKRKFIAWFERRFNQERYLWIAERVPSPRNYIACEDKDLEILFGSL